MLLKGIATFNVTALLADPKVQAAVVVFIEAAEKASGQSWLYVLPGAALPKVRAIMISGSKAKSCSRPAVLVWVLWILLSESTREGTTSACVTQVCVCLAGSNSSHTGHECCGFRPCGAGRS